MRVRPVVEGEGQARLVRRGGLGRGGDRDPLVDRVARGELARLRGGAEEAGREPVEGRRVERHLRVEVDPLLRGLRGGGRRGAGVARATGVVAAAVGARDERGAAQHGREGNQSQGSRCSTRCLTQHAGLQGAHARTNPGCACAHQVNGGHPNPNAARAKSPPPGVTRGMGRKVPVRGEGRAMRLSMLRSVTLGGPRPPQTPNGSGPRGDGAPRRRLRPGSLRDGSRRA